MSGCSDPAEEIYLSTEMIIAGGRVLREVLEARGVLGSISPSELVDRIYRSMREAADG